MKDKKQSWLKGFFSKPGIQFDDNLFSLDSNSIDQESISNDKPSNLLGRFDDNEVFQILKDLHIIDKLEKFGFENILFDIDIRSYLDQRIHLYYNEKNRRHLLIEIRLTKGDAYRNIKHTINKREYSFLLIEWLVMQNPKLKLWEKKRRLPGQDYPGLPLGYALIDFFQIIANFLELDGLLCYPEFFHNAYFYSKYFYFIDYKKQAEFLSILRDFCMIDIDKISNKIETGDIIDINDNTYDWLSKEQVMPIDEQMISFFQSNKYIQNVYENMKRFRFKKKKNETS